MKTGTVVRLVLVVLLTTIAVVLAGWLLYRLQEIIVWTILALFLAVALGPSVNWLNAHHVPRALGILAMYAAVLVVIAALNVLVVPPLGQQVAQLFHALQQPGGLSTEADRLAAPLGLGNFVRTIHPQLEAAPGQLVSSIGSLQAITTSTITTVLGVLSVAVCLLLSSRRRRHPRGCNRSGSGCPPTACQARRGRLRRRDIRLHSGQPGHQRHCRRECPGRDARAGDPLRAARLQFCWR